MSVTRADLTAVRMQTYSDADVASIGRFVDRHGAEYDGLANLLTDWRDTMDLHVALTDGPVVVTPATSIISGDVIREADGKARLVMSVERVSDRRGDERVWLVTLDRRRRVRRVGPYAPGDIVDRQLGRYPDLAEQEASEL